MKVTDEMVNRFLWWKLPRDFAPDCGISFDGRKPDQWNPSREWPVGTNLFTAVQARAMLEHVLGGDETLKPLAFDIADVAPDQSDTRAWGYGARDTQPWRMRFDPATGEPNPYPSHAEQYRDYHGCVAWLINPWTGTARDARDIGTDVYGRLIVFKEPNK